MLFPLLSGLIYPYDYESYVAIYESNALGSHIEIGWKWLINFLNFLDLPAQDFYSFFYSHLWPTFLKLAKKYGYIINLSYIALIYLQSYSLVRSSFLLSCVLFIIFKISSKYSLTVIVILLAILGFTIHKTAFFYIPVFLLSKFLTLNVILKKDIF